MSRLWTVLLPWLKRPHAPFVLLLLVYNIALNGSLIWGGGVPLALYPGQDLYNGYGMGLGSWSHLWNDGLFPGMPRVGSELSSTHLLLNGISFLVGDNLLGARLLSWALNNAAMLSMYLLATRLTGSRSAGIVASVVYVLNSGSLLSLGMPLAAGYAVSPLVILAGIGLLKNPSVKKSAILALAAGIFLTLTTPSFAYVVGLALLVIILSQLIAVAIQGQQFGVVLSLLRQRLIYLALALGLTALIASYYLVGFVLGTAPLLDELASADTVEIARVAPSLWDAVALVPPDTEPVSGLVRMSGWLLAVAAVALAMLRFDYRVGALLFILVTSVSFATDVDSVAYSSFASVMPFSEMLGQSSLWMALTLTAYSLLLAIGFAGIADRLILLREYRSLWSASSDMFRVHRRLLVPMLAGVLVVAIVLVNVGAQFSTLKEWTSSVKVTSDASAPFQELSDDDSRFAVLTTPIFADYDRPIQALVTSDVGTVGGTLTSGQRAIDRRTFGGLDLSEDAIASLEEIQADLIAALPSIVLTQEPVILGGPADNLEFIGTVEVIGESSEPSAMELRFREHDSENYLSLTLELDRGRVTLTQAGAEPQFLASSIVAADISQEAEVRLVVSGAVVRVWINGQRVVQTNAVSPTAGSVSARALGPELALKSVEIARYSNSAFQHDDVLARFLGLYGAKDLIVQPGTSQVERHRVAAISGFTRIGEWGKSILYENRHHKDGEVFVTSAHGVYLGESDVVLPPLLQLDSVAGQFVALINADDIPEEAAGGIWSGALFLALDADRSYESIVQAIEGTGYEVPPLLYVSDIKGGIDGSLVRPHSVPGAIVANPTAVDILARARNFVLEADLESAEDGVSLPRIVLQFRVRDTLNFYTFELGGGLPSEMVKTVNGERVVLKKGEVVGTRERLTIRVSAEGESFSLFLGDSLLIQASDADFSEIGPVTIKADSPGVLVTRIGASTDRDGESFRAELRESGFDLQGAMRNSALISRDQFGLFPDMSVNTSRIQGVRRGSYRVIVGVRDAQPPVLLGEIDNEGTRMPIIFLRLEGGDTSTEEAQSRTWFVSEPIAVDGRVDVFAAAPGVDARIDVIYLAEESALSDDSLSTLLFDAPMPPALESIRHSASKYSGDVAGDNVSVAVLREAFHEGWQAKIDGTPVTHFPVYGALNGYLVASDSGRLTIEFAPQRTFRIGLLGSGLGVIVALFLVFRGIPRSRRSA